MRGGGRAALARVLQLSRAASGRRPRPTQLGAWRVWDIDSRSKDLFDEIRLTMGNAVSIVLWGTEPLARKLAAAWCSDLTWQLRLVRAKCRVTKLLTPQPQLHAAEAPMRLAKAKLNDFFYELDAENWSLQSGQQRGRSVPTWMRGENIVAFLYGGQREDQRQQLPQPRQQPQQPQTRCDGAKPSLVNGEIRYAQRRKLSCRDASMCKICIRRGACEACIRPPL